ncbi:unnamed protein product [Didymodactylos carnosus]|uniref:tRNA pseudouridine synthase n=1 Tax=Didymodactylos carnosus TaxID=1234261 RepID=A0A814SRJ0_9BILA|nr:unnamed protein product [Didymodactylos carnosus]CAF1279839.1 unnamed protein product [Didymodactylos carnosus]CAF3915369.1 unnamed protein product [Didymodactylos carnosus]CAF4084705.1 unnamed protein product [Didymodactylos carnosus]
MRILLYLSYRDYAIKGNFPSPSLFATDINYVQDIIEKSILKFCPSRRPNILLSTYTECFVHSICNTATIDFQLPGKQKIEDLNTPWFKFNMNKILYDSKRTMRVLDAKFVHDAFDPKLATNRTYIYRFISGEYPVLNTIEEHLTTYIPCQREQSLCLNRLNEAISIINNNMYDYSSFTTPEARQLLKQNQVSTKRKLKVKMYDSTQLFQEVDINKKNKNHAFSIELTTSNFLYQMVRRLSTCLIQIGQGLLNLNDLKSMLTHQMEYQPMDGLLNLNGLYLKNVEYNERDFNRYVTVTTSTTTTSSKLRKIDPLAPIMTGEE